MIELTWIGIYIVGQGRRQGVTFVVSSSSTIFFLIRSCTHKSLCLRSSLSIVSFIL